MSAKLKSTLLISLLCAPVFATTLYGRRFTCEGGQVFISSEGVVEEPPAIANELMQFKPEVEGHRVQVFTPATPADARALEAYLYEQTRNSFDGSAQGHLVVIECIEHAGQRFKTEGGARVIFDDSGRALVTEVTYQDIRPAFTGDGTSPDKTAPVLTYIGLADDLVETATESGQAPSSTAILNIDVEQRTSYDELEPDTDGMGHQAPSAAALEIASFNAAPALPLTPAPLTPQSPADLNQPDSDEAQANSLNDTVIIDGHDNSNANGGSGIEEAAAKTQTIVNSASSSKRKGGAV